MESAVKKEYFLDGLCCSHCAAGIEQEIRDLDGVRQASVDFPSKTLRVEYSGPERGEALVCRAETIAKRYNPDIVIKEKGISGPGKRTLFLNGLDCADCAAKIEREIRRIPGVTDASVDFASQRMTVSAGDGKDLPGILDGAVSAVKRLEPDVTVSFRKTEAGEDDSEKRKELFSRIGLCAGAALYACAMFFSFPPAAELALFLISFLLVGGEVLLKAAKNIRNGRVFDENFLMSVATIGAFAIGEFPEGVAVMLFYQVGELFQDYAVNRSRRSIESLMDIRPDFANLKTEDGVRRVSPEEVGTGSTIVIKPGEKIPLDGRVTEGRSSLNTSALTGESLPYDVGPGSDVLSGSINQSGVLTVEVTREFGESTVSKILDLVQNAGSKKAPAENFITKFARCYTPAVVGAALVLAAVPPLVIPGAVFSDWLYRALAFLVVSCPCALVISIPLSFFGGIGGASRNGILIKGSNYLEALNRTETVVFDKTGTLTKGSFTVTRTAPASGFTEQQLLDYAAHAEGSSNHPIALSIRRAYGAAVDAGRVSEQEELAGRGVRVKVDGKTVLAGNAGMMEDADIPFEVPDENGTVVFLAVDGAYAGYLVISDEIKPDSRKAIPALKKAGVKTIAMLTGDNRAAAEKTAAELGIDTVYAGLLPAQKVERLELLDSRKSPKGKLLFVGDGINDAPVLARADIGVAMGGIGSDAAIEAADIVLMTDEPSKLVQALRIAAKTHRIVWQNIVFALAVKAVILVLAAFGIATMWEAVFGDVGVALIAVLNALRAMKGPGGKSV